MEVAVSLRSLVPGDETPLAVWLEDSVVSAVIAPSSFLQEVARSEADEVRAVCLGEALIGLVGLQNVEPPALPTTASLAILLAPEARGRGLGRKALALLVDLARERGLIRVWLEVHRTNAAAIRVYEGSGFVLEADLGATLRYGRRL